MITFDDDQEDIEKEYEALLQQPMMPTQYWDYIFQLPCPKEDGSKHPVDFQEFFQELRNIHRDFFNDFFSLKIKTVHPVDRWKVKTIEIPCERSFLYTTRMPHNIENIIVFMPFIGFSKEDENIISNLLGNIKESSLFVFPTRQSIAKYYQYVTDESVILLGDLMDALYSLAKEKLSKETEVYHLIEVFYYKVKYAIALSQLIEQY